MIAVALVLGLVVGIALGSAYFVALRKNVSLYLSPGRRGAAIGLHLARLIAICGALVGAARFGAGVLLAVTTGILIARFAVVRRPVRIGEET